MTVDADRLVAALPAYEIGEELGRGSWGIVVAGVHRQLGRDVAIKQLPRAYGSDPAVRRRFLAEARMLASLAHPHVVPIYDFVEHDGVCVLVMERLTGGTVWSRFKRRGLSAEESCATILATCAALEYAHSRGVLHRDVKPDNLMLSGDGVLKVTDFGIAKVVGGMATVATRTGEILGTPAYMAPEQAQVGELTARTDLYAAGMILYELLSGELAFPEGTDPISLLFRHVYEEPRPLLDTAPDVPPQLASVVMRAIARDPADRWESAEAFGVEVARAAAEAWGRGWLARSTVNLITGGPILAAALAESVTTPRPTLPPPAMPTTPPPQPAVPTAPPALVEETPAEVVPVSELRETLTGAAPIAPSSTPPPTLEPEPPSRRRWARIAAVAVPLLVLVVAVAAWFARGGGGGDDGSENFELASQWRTVHDAPTARQQVASATVDGTMWLAGGVANGQGLRTVEGYDPAIDNWKPGPDLPVALHHATAVDYRHQLVVLGGWIPNELTLTATTSNRVFALRGSQWAELPPLRRPRAAAAAAVVGDKIVVVGGQAGGELVAETEVFDGAEWKDAAPIPTKREHLAAAADGEYVYVVGGRVLSADRNLATLERYDPESNRWRTLEPMPTARGGLGAAIVEERLFAVGGEDPAGIFDAVEAYDIDGDTWSTQPSLRSPRHGLGVAGVNSALYAVGGARRPGHEDAVAVAEVLSSGGVPPTPKGQWQTLKDAPTARQQLAAAETDGSVWIVGGIVGDKATAKVEAYDPAIDAWKAGPAFPFDVHHATAVTLGGDLVVLGGWEAQGSNLTAKASDRVYALRDGAWVELPRMARPRAAAAAAVVGDKVVLVGGQADGKLVAETEVFDGHGWRDVAPMPTPREHVAAVSDGKFVYVVGGRDLSPAKNVAALERYDPATNTWQRLPDMLTARGGLGAAVVDGRIVAVGGEDPAAAFDAVEAYDINGRSWASLPSLHSPTHGAAVVGIGKSVYVMGGARRPGHRDSTAVAEAFALA